MTVYDVIDAKKNGRVLGAEEIGYFVNEVAQGGASDAQIAAFCMAVLLNGMTDGECFALTRAMAESGARTPRPAEGVFADKHSTGGVSDSTTLVLVPVLAALGVPCAKYSGRGLGHTGGTLDKLESFPGLTVSLSPERFARQVREVGAAVAGQTADTVPADKRMYAVRDVTATVDSIPLIASSVMSKKLASFADVILLDVKYGSGAFMHTPKRAEKLARLMVSIGEAAGRRMCAAVTCMDAPLGDAVGCNAEAREACEVLSGKQNDLSRLSLFHASKLAAAVLRIPEEEAQRRAEEAVGSGAAREKFAQMVAAQGGDARYVFEPQRFSVAPCAHEVRAAADGFLNIDALALGRACVEMGGGRKREGDAVDHTCAILLKRRPGVKVRAGELLAEVCCNAPVPEAFALADGAFTLSRRRRVRPLVYAYIGGSGRA